jgi:hypothetical protein
MTPDQFDALLIYLKAILDELRKLNEGKRKRSR